MKRFLVLCLTLGMVGVTLPACSLLPAATPVPVPPTAAAAPPEQTPIALPPAPAPSATAPQPTAPPPLPSTEFTAAPTEMPTPDPNAGVGDVVYEDKFDGTSGWGWAYADESVAFSLSNNRLNAVMKQGNVGPRFTIRDDVRVGDQLVRVTAYANLCYTNDDYGLMFRVNPDNFDGYVFKLNCEGRARLELMKGGQASPLVEWAVYPAIVPNAPSENTLMVRAVKDRFDVYVNNKYLFSATDNTYAEGAYGFYVRDRTNGGLSVSFANLIAKAVMAP